MNGLFMVMPQHLSWIEVRTFTWLLQNLNLVFLSHSEVDLLVCLGSLSCCINQVHMSLRPQTDGQTFSFKIF